MAQLNRPQRSYLSKDFGDFKADLLRYAKTYFPNRIRDFSESSVGGLVLDLAAAVSDNMSFYLDHQFRELSWSDAIEISNIEKMITNAGVKITGASPAVVNVKFYIEVSAVLSGGSYVPDSASLPVIQAGTEIQSTSGISFSTIEDVDFGEVDRFNVLLASITVGSLDSSNNPATLILSRSVTAVSGKVYTEKFSFDSSTTAYKTVTLSNPDVSTIISVVDSDGNKWYEVESLTQDTVMVGVINRGVDGELVRDSLEVVPAPRRFVVSTALQNRTTTLKFGGGTIDSAVSDSFDPTRAAIPLYGRPTVPRVVVDPGSLVRSNTTGVVPLSTTLTVTYRAGGGQAHNVGVNSIRSIKTLQVDFKDTASSSTAATVRSSIDVTNESPAVGGDTAPSIEKLRSLIPTYRNAQSRVVTKSDLLARVYSLPSIFGSVYKAGVRSDTVNPGTTQLYIISRDSRGRLSTSTDTLKTNLKRYLNDYRLIGDSVDILDCSIINIGVNVTVVPSTDSNSIDVVQGVIASLQALLPTTNMQVDKPISISEILATVTSTKGVSAVTRLELVNVTSSSDGRSYSDVTFDIEANITRGLIIGSPGSIFELRYPSYDIVVSTE